MRFDIHKYCLNENKLSLSLRISLCEYLLTIYLFMFETCFQLHHGRLRGKLRALTHCGVALSTGSKSHTILETRSYQGFLSHHLAEPDMHVVQKLPGSESDEELRTVGVRSFISHGNCALLTDADLKVLVIERISIHADTFRDRKLKCFNICRTLLLMSTWTSKMSYKLEIHCISKKFICLGIKISKKK